MCRHNNDNRVMCIWEDYYNSHINPEKYDVVNSALPVDTNGVCLFHSSDIEWKRNNNFVERLTALIDWAGHDVDMEDISFDDFVLVGNCTLVNTAWEKHDYKLDSTNKHILYFQNVRCRKNIVFHNAKFLDPLIIENGFFKADLIIDHCVFEDSISLNRLSIEANLYIQESEFKRHLIWDGSNRVFEHTTIIDTKFYGRTLFSGLVLDNHVVFDNNIFVKSEYVNEFNCSFDGGLDFTRNEFTDLHFDACRFYGDCTFAELTQHHSFAVFNPIIQGQVSFVGTAEHLLFNPNTRIYLNEDCFEGGHVTFEYCNVKDLGVAFVDNIKTLEDLELVRISTTCQVERLTMIYEYYPYTSLKANIIEDFTHLVARYFRRWHAVNLTVKIDRNKDKRTIRVVFKTTDDISDDEFQKIMRRFSQTVLASMQSTDEEILDIVNTYRNIIDRLQKSNNSIGVEQILEIISMQGAIQTVTLNINQNTTMKINNSQIGIIATGNNANIQNNDITQKFVCEIDYDAMAEELRGLIRVIKREKTDCDDIIDQLQNAVDAVEQKNDCLLKDILNKMPGWVLKAASGIGIGVLSNLISQTVGI